MEVREIASGLRFPEGPIALPDGSVILVEIAAGRVTRVYQDGKKEELGDCGGGPNGAAVGPDERIYICNNGGFQWSEVGGLLLPGHQPDDYQGGSIQVVDMGGGLVQELYSECDGRPLRGPNDIVFDDHGGFWFTDHGKTRPRERDVGAVYYAWPGGGAIQEVIPSLDAPNGIGLSPDGTRLYVAETWTGRLWSWEVTGAGEVKREPGLLPHGGTLVAGLPGLQLFDSLAVEDEGNVCVATLVNGGITTVSPDGSEIEHVPMPDPLTTNICFGGEGNRTAYITLSGTGRLVAVDWPREGLTLNY